MHAGHLVFSGIGFALVLLSVKLAQQCKIIPTFVVGTLAWAAYAVPKWLIWPIPDPRDMRWLLLIGAVLIIGGKTALSRRIINLNSAGFVARQPHQNLAESRPQLINKTNESSMYANRKFCEVI